MLSSERRKRLEADVALLTVAVIWGTAFVVQRVAALNIGVFLFTGWRFLLGGLVLLPFAGRARFKNPTLQGLGRKNLVGVLTVGLLLWGGAALQQAGLRFTTAANAGFITGLYVVLIPLFLALVLRQSPRTPVWVAACLAAIGLFLLSTGGRMQLNPGDLLELAGAVLWAWHVILVGRLVRQMELLQLVIGQYLVCGCLGLLVGVWVEKGLWLSLAQGWWAVVYTGVLSVGLGYTLQAFGQRVAPPADAAILLSLEAVFAALFGWLLLGESLSGVQLLGCGVILSGMLVSQLSGLRGRKGELP